MILTSSRLAGSVNLTVPLATLLDLDGPPGEVAGFGPVDAGTTRALAAAAARHPATRWCVTVTDEAGRVIGHGCRRREHGPQVAVPAATVPVVMLRAVALPALMFPGGGAACGGAACGDGAPGGRALLIKIDPLAVGCCAHERETAGYQLTPRLRHLIQSGTGPARSPAAGGPPRGATKITPWPTIRAAGLRPAHGRRHPADGSGTRMC